MLSSVCRNMGIVRLSPKNSSITNPVRFAVSLHRCVSTVRDGSALHLRGLPKGLSESLAYSLFSSYGSLKELLVYDDNYHHYDSNNNNSNADKKKSAIVTFDERSSAFSCRAELHWRPLSLSSSSSSPGSDIDSECMHESAKHRNIVKIDFETEFSQQSLPNWIQKKRKASRQLLPLYQKIHELLLQHKTRSDPQQQQDSDQSDDVEVVYEAERLQLETELKQTKEKLMQSSVK